MLWGLSGQDNKIIDHLVAIDEVKQRGGLEFLRKLPDSDEVGIEDNDFRDWAKVYIDAARKAGREIGYQKGATPPAFKATETILAGLAVTMF